MLSVPNVFLCTPSAGFLPLQDKDESKMDLLPAKLLAATMGIYSFEVSLRIKCYVIKQSGFSIPMFPLLDFVLYKMVVKELNTFFYNV